MTAFDAARNHGDPGLERVHATPPRLRVISGGGWRLAWHRYGPLLLIALAAGLGVGSYIALLARELGW